MRRRSKIEQSWLERRFWKFYHWLEEFMTAELLLGMSLFLLSLIFAFGR